ncbi:MAG: hypothetical protein Q4D24_01370 [Erysipelotrichaceae bacterium]|nr:hypothetical protein [Erysipelotrichaceae bacterium]
MEPNEYKLITLGRKDADPEEPEYSALFLSGKDENRLIEFAYINQEMECKEYITADPEQKVLETVGHYRNLLFIDKDMVMAIFEHLEESDDESLVMWHGLSLMEEYARKNGIFISREKEDMAPDVLPLADLFLELVKKYEGCEG